MTDDESEGDRLRRNVNELLQELRVAQAGVQILFGFLLAVTFTESYEQATKFQQMVHLVTVLLAVLAIALFTAPAAWHRVLFRQGRRDLIVDSANTFAIVGLATLALAVTGTVLLLTDVIIGQPAAAILAAVTAIGFGTLWFAVPARHRRRGGGA
ncbi:hypothetical protein SAMN05192558_115143 [Actinokineospora alba]|uniref:Sodium:proton antiporter n=1 Tax=Actinokineospora alba TaxID=504798 RepID=A0A1H0VUW3_9PSEU|nr:DUF6328 family protein [Actinokineospora alba]TDP70057.1 hypothetical protein C8E96_5657 [Actinokineospora alba]SDI40144.1 hypothetical protein SAMN05421871_104494 [Actinokineospora alba]SDP82184.1 hypothetical protein SAMN05192558_115143 [Actinokineospora alba]